MYRGKVDEWRFIRNNTYLLHCSLIEDKHRVEIAKALPLPFDDDLEEPEMTEEEMREAYDKQLKVVELWQKEKNGR